MAFGYYGDLKVPNSKNTKGFVVKYAKLKEEKNLLHHMGANQKLITSDIFRTCGVIML